MENRPSRFSVPVSLKRTFWSGARIVKREIRDTGTGWNAGISRTYVYLRRNGGDDSARGDTETEECNRQLGQAGFSPVLRATASFISIEIGRFRDIFPTFPPVLPPSFFRSDPSGEISWEDSPLSRKGFSRYSVRKWSVAKREMVY